jgi:purine-binding chemotaxis protein CheW
MLDEIIDDEKVELITDDDNEKCVEPIVRLITFHLENEIYGVEVRNVREILLLNQSFPVPGAPDFVLGITNIRGNVLTIIDARRRFNLSSVDLSEPPFDKSARMIVMESGDATAAVLVDSVSDVIDVKESAIDLNPKIKVNGDSMYINGVVSHLDNLIIILNVKEFLDEGELGMVSGL